MMMNEQISYNEFNNERFNLLSKFHQSNNLNEFSFDEVFNDFDISCEYFDLNDLCKKFKNENGVKMLSYNIRSLQKNLESLKEILSFCKENNNLIHIIALQESFQIHSEDDFKIDNYNFIYQSRKDNARGGGIFFYVHDSFKFNKILKTESSNLWL